MAPFSLFVLFVVMLESFVIFLGLQLLGEVLSRAGGWTVPGPVVGLLLLCALLIWRRTWVVRMEGAAAALHRHMALLFVPAGVGVMRYTQALRDEWLALSVALVGSTICGLAVTAWVTARLMRRLPADDATSSAGLDMP